MKQIKFISGLSLLLGLFLWSSFAQKNDKLFTLCVTSETGEPLIYVEIENSEGEQLAVTDLNGCIRLQASTEQMEIVLKYPGYENKQMLLKAGEPQSISLPEIKELPAMRMPSGDMITPTESRGEFLIEGTIKDEEGEPLIGASILIDGTTTGSTTDIDGTFYLHTATECINLIISYVGYETLSLDEICAGSPKAFQMKAAAVELDDLMLTALETSRVKKSEARALMMLRTGESKHRSSDIAAPPPPPPPASAAVREIYEESYAPSAYSLEEDVAVTYDSDPSVVTKSGEALPGAGQLTAGEVNDFSKWEMWTDINQEDLGMYRTTWQQYADHRYTLQLTNKEGSAINNAAVELVDGQGNVFWKARTDAQGRAELWAHYFDDVRVAANSLTIRGAVDGKVFELKQAKPFREGINFHSLGAACREQAMIDVAFVVDATGSMGDEIRYLQAELLDVINRVQSSLPAADLQMGSVFYRDQGERYLTKTQALTKDPAQAVAFLQQQEAEGGGDYPEAVETALETALDSLQWRNGASSRLLFLVLDAPPHAEAENLKRLQVAVTKAAVRGIQIVPVSCSGVDKSTEYLLRSMALATNGTYTFVTDHSGIGNAHIEPSTDSYEVEYLNDVLVRLTVSMSQLNSCEKPIVVTDPVVLPNAPKRNWDYYPNPSSGPLTIRFTEANGTFYLADTQGKLLQRFTAADDLKLDLQPYPAGTYWLRHEAADGTLTQGQVLLLRR